MTEQEIRDNAPSGGNITQFNQMALLVTINLNKMRVIANGCGVGFALMFQVLN